MTFPVNIHQNYHAHFYFDKQSGEFAADFYQRVSQQFDLYVGRFNQKRVGPHTKWSFEIDFTHQQFESLIPWLEANRNGHTILVHAVTGDDYLDHTRYVYWLGEPIELDITGFTAGNLS